MAPLAVDPEALYAAGSAVVAIGDGLAASLTALTAGFAANTGHDLAGMVFGLAYQDAAKSLLKAATAAVNACRKIGALMQQGASNYSAVDAASTLGGGGGVLPSPCPPAELGAPGPPGTLGPGQPPPLLWWLVQSLVHDVWPDGDVAGLRAAAARWRGFGAAVGGVRGTLNASKTLLDTQHLPEGDKIDAALTEMGTAAQTIGEQCGKLATTIDRFADRVDHAQHAIRDLLHRLESLADFGHDVMLIIEGDALDEVEKIAKDINDVLQQLGQEARAYEQGIRLVMQAADGEIVKCEKYARRALVQFLGDDVGNPVATGFDIWINVDEGALKDAVGMGLSLADLSPHWFFVDPQGAAATWTGMGKGLWKGSLFNGFLNPKEYVAAKVQELKGLLHLDDWSRARPGLGAGENFFDVVTAVVPGVGEAGAAADGAGAVARGAEAEAEAAGAAGRVSGKAAEGAGGLVGARGAFTDITKAGGDLTKNLEGVTKDLPKIDPPASGTPVALPPGKPFEAPVESGPRPPDAGPGAPVGPHDPAPAPAGSPGVAGGPPATPPAAGGPHGSEPAPTPPSAPSGPVGPHDPVPAPPSPPAAPGGPGGLPDPAPAAGTPPGAGGPHDPAPAPGTPPSVPLGDPHEPAPAPAEAPHDPVSAPSNGPHDPEPSPPQAPTTPAGSHDPQPAPPGSPHEPASEGPHEPVSPPVEPARAEGPRDPVSAPADGPHEPASVPGGGAPLTSVPAPVGERMPPTITQPAEHPPERAPTPPSGSPTDPAPVPAYSPQAVAVAKSTPHVTAPGGRPAELPPIGGSPRAPGKGGPGGGEPKPPNNAGQQPPRDLPGGQHHMPTEGGDHGTPPGSLRSDDLSALSDYTGLGYRGLNEALRSDALEASQFARVEALINALKKLPAYDGSVVRGTNLPPEVLAQYRPDEYVIEKAFLSTSRNPVVAQSSAFAGNVEFRIVSITGRDISSFSMFPEEQEILFPAHTRFLVISKKVDPLTGRTIIEMVED